MQVQSLIDLHKDGSNSLYERRDISSLGTQKEFKEEEMPGFGISLLTAILPVILMLISTIVQLITGHEEATNVFEQIVYFIGTAGTAMLIAVIFAIFTMGMKQQRKMEDIMKSVTHAIYPIGMMLLIIGGGGTFKQVLIDGGVGDTIAKMFEGTSMSPILLAWIVAAVLRISWDQLQLLQYQQQALCYHF